MRTYLAMLLESHPDPYGASALDVPDIQNSISKIALSELTE
jgi:hypothetical protein